MRIFPFSKYTGNKGVFLYCLFFILIPFSSKAQSDKKIVKYALQAEDEGAYDQAVLYFQSLASLEKLSISQLLVYLDCLVKRRDLDRANQLTELIENKTKGNPPVLYYLIKGDLGHQNTDFDEAITHYKKFIRLADSDDPLRDSAKDRLLTCSYARRNNSWKDGVGILPFAKGINSSGDEVKPIFSKNLNGVFYFGAANSKSIGGRRLRSI
jgi:tetratricopeptide (TPR) repeat protein